MLTVARNFLRPRFSVEMGRKLITRLRERGIGRATPDSTRWCAGVCSDWDQYCRQTDSALWDEATHRGAMIAEAAEQKLSTLDFDLGGGGNYPLLYFLVRRQRPSVVVETGVAAGYSSVAILLALRENGRGRLYSSDFPYFRLKTPEKYIGFLVDDDLRRDWVCLTRGDKENLPEILSQVRHVDLFHYDSDKSYAGRRSAMELVYPRLRQGSVVVMDDISDNYFFRDFTTANRVEPMVFAFGGKYVGMFRV